MQPQPTLITARLVLRPFVIDDAVHVHQLAGDPRIADTTLNVPHPYQFDDALRWIGDQREKYDAGEQATFAVTLAGSHTLIGAVGLIHEPRHRRAELGYWIGVEYWNHGYCTEAGRAVVDFAFDIWRLRKMTVHCFLRNKASARVIEKIGFQREGLCWQHVRKGEQYEDVVLFGLLREQWEQRRTS